MQPKPLIDTESSATKPVLDLCDSCVHADECSLQAEHSGPVHHCDEFDDGHQDVRTAPALVAVPDMPASDPEPPPAPEIGLCANCDLREECTLPRAPGGVWFCEEYQ